MSASGFLRAVGRLQRHSPSAVAGPSYSSRIGNFPSSSIARFTSTSTTARVASTDAQSAESSIGSNALFSSVNVQADSIESSDRDVKVIESHREAIALLRKQPLHYVVASMVGKTLLLHERDLFSVPRINDVQVGDVLELDRIHEVGSRDFTLRAQDSLNTRSRGTLALERRSTPFSNVPENVQLPSDDTYLPESDSWAARLRPGGLAHKGALLSKDVVRVRCTVVEHTKGPMELIVKKKRRKGYRRTIRHKQTYSRLRVEALQIGG